MIREPWGYDNHSHRVILNVGSDRYNRKQKREISISSNILNRPRLVVLFVIIAILISLFLKETKMVLASNPQFVIQDVVLENANLISRDMIDNILNLKDNKGLFSVSTSQIVKMLKKDPDVGSVVVEKILPGTLKIIINERIPYFRLNASEKKYFIDSSGIVLLRDRPSSSAPAITGLKIDKLTPGESCMTPELNRILNILKTADNLGLSKFIEITEVGIDNDNYITIKTRERIVVRLKIENIDERLNKLVSILNDVQVKRKLIKLVDLRFKDIYVE